MPQSRRTCKFQRLMRCGSDADGRANMQNLSISVARLKEAEGDLEMLKKYHGKMFETAQV